MPLTAALDSGTALRRRLALVVRVRWFGVLFGVLQIAAYDVQPYPGGVQGAGYAVMGAVGALNLLLALTVHRAPAARLAPLGVASVVLDLVGVSALVYLYAFDPLSAIFVLLALVPIEAAGLFGLPGAMWAWAATAVSYAGREWYGTVFDNPWESSSVTFRVGLLGIIALLVGLQSRDLQRQRQAAAAALVDARLADAWRGRLVAMLAHDLRSPLSGARTGLATLRELGGRLTTDDAIRVVDGVGRQLDRMLAMTRDLLDLARAEEGRLVLDRRPVRLADVVARALELVGAWGEKVCVEVPDDLDLVADGDRLEQVVANLLSNAVRHGEPPVEVTAWRRGDDVCLAVRDHGVGLPDEVRQQAFEAFVTTERALGVGLGTWVVAHLVELHGGSVWYEDASPGARFVVALPADGVSPDPDGHGPPAAPSRAAP